MKCPECHGLGKTSDRSEDCPICDGDGEMEVEEVIRAIFRVLHNIDLQLRKLHKWADDMHAWRVRLGR